MQTTQILRNIRDIVDTANSILISGQGNPDGDSIGSQLALYDILQQRKRMTGHVLPDNAIVIANDILPPSHYRFLPHFHVVVPIEEIAHRQFDAGFILDASKERIGKVLPVFRKCRYSVNIDHHTSREKSQEDVGWVDPNICSVAEMIYDFIEHPDWNVTLNADIATCLYTGIIYDTGSFRYPSTTARTHRIVAALLETGIDFGKIAEKVLMEKRFPAVQLLGSVLHNLQRNATAEIIWGTITQALLDRVHADPEEDEGLISQYAFTRGARVAVLFKERPANEVKVSLRSRGTVDVGRFAKKMSSLGGGHERAAGCTLKGTMEEVQTLVIQALENEL